MRSATRSTSSAPTRRPATILKTSLHDFEGDKTYTEKLGHNFPLNKTFAEVKPADYDAVYVAGGRGPEYIRIDKRVQAIIRHFHETDKPIFTICHGVQVLMAVPETIRGKEVAALRILRAGGDGGRRQLHRRAADRRACRRQARLGQGLAGPRRVHARMPEGARHRDPPRRAGAEGEGGLSKRAPLHSRRERAWRCGISATTRTFEGRLTQTSADKGDEVPALFRQTRRAERRDLGLDSAASLRNCVAA